MIAVKPIPSTGETVPVVGLGTWRTFDVGSSPRVRKSLEGVLTALAEAGRGVVDSSPMYGRSEQVVGETVERAGLRPRLFLATKVWTSGREAGIRQMEASIAKLRVEPLDLIQVHNLVDVSTHLATLREWKEKGRVRYIGITHYTASAHEAVERIVEREPLDFLQINYSAGEREAEARLLPLASDRGVAVIANRPFASGDLLGRLRSRPLPSFAADLDCEAWPQLLLKFVWSHPAVTCAIPATGDEGHLRENLRAGMGAMPDEPLRRRIAAAFDAA